MRIPRFSFLFLILLYWVHLFNHILLVSGLCHENQQSLLLELKDNLIFNHVSSTKLVSWNQSYDCCQWTGVTCDNEGYVIGLDLRNESISGTLENSSALFDLHYLQSLNLAYNNFSSVIPSVFHKLEGLSYLNLSNAGFEGQVPMEISQLTRLATLDMSTYSKLKLENPNLRTLVRNLTDIRRLHLDGVSVSASGQEWCSALSSLSDLQELSLSRCNLSGPIDSSLVRLEKLTELSYLNLSFNAFTGSLPSFHVFRNLSHLDLSHNNFTNSIPSTHLEGLQNLVEIQLQNNSLSGTIPSSLFSLPLLQNIQLSHNHFEGQLDEFPNSSSSIIHTLDLSHNNLEGPIPMSVFNLSRLSILILSSNRLNGTIHLDVVLSLKSLTSLDLSHNHLFVYTNVTNVDHSSFPNLTNLMLASCNLTEFPSFLAKQSRLSSLDVSQNQIKGAIPQWIWNLQLLVRLDLSHNLLTKLEEPMQEPSDNLFMLDLHSNNLHGPLPTFPKYAAYLDFSNNNFSSVIPPGIGDRLSAAIVLSLSHNSFYGRIPDSICSAANLQILDLSSNKLEGTIPPCLAKSETLTALLLRKNKLSGSIPDTFPLSCSLRTMDLKQNRLGGTIPKSLANCVELEVLDLGSNRIMDGFPCLLDNISTLQVLVVRKNRLHGPIGCPETNSSKKMLKIVDLAFNNFTGRLPGKFFRNWEMMMPAEHPAAAERSHLGFEVGGFNGVYYQDAVSVTYKGRQMRFAKQLTVLTAIDLSSNCLEGPIPEELMSFKELYVLNLSRNNLSGQIPSSIQNLKQLESLDLSRNNLGGKIPQELAALTFLSFLNLSFNHLVGMIPAGTQLQTFEASSFEGNDGLYGPPLTTSPDNTGLSPSAPASALPPPAQATGSGRSLAINWNILSVELGLVFGLGIVIGPLLFWKQWRIRYWRCADNILCRIFPRLHIRVGGTTTLMISD